MLHHDVIMRRVNRTRKRIAKIRIGLPDKVEFTYKQGTVICYPKERRWMVQPKNQRAIRHILKGRNDVTKHKARHLLKFAIAKILREDK